jgi:hypothetical protein
VFQKIHRQELIWKSEPYNALTAWMGSFFRHPIKVCGLIHGYSETMTRTLFCPRLHFGQSPSGEQEPFK